MNWETKLVNVELVDFDYDLKQFEVYSKKGRLLGCITPATTEDMKTIIEDLNNGGCPVADFWEDGMGNTCTMEGWGGEDRNMETIYEKLKKNEEERNKLEDMDIETNMDFSVRNKKTGQEGYAETYFEKVIFIVPDEGMKEYNFSIEDFNRDFIVRE